MSTLIRCGSPVSSLSNLIDEMFANNIFSLGGRDISATTWPRVDIAESKDSYRLRADLPGIAREDIAVSVENGVLSISGEKKVEEKEHEKDRFYHYERNYGKFLRSFNLPEEVDAGSIEATYNNGVLELTMKKIERAKPKAIEVKVN